jgi:AAA domain/Primase C terminal 2 (PriCT-2)/RepB DNA-primase from phage plasmid
LNSRKSQWGQTMLSEAVRFLQLIDPSEKSAFAFQTFKERGDHNPRVQPRVICCPHLDPNEEVLAELACEHDKGAGIYVAPGESDGQGRKSENITRVRAIWQEDDSGYDGAFPLTPSIVVQTSPGHFHRYWLLSDEWPTDEQGRADFTAVMERMVETYGSDPNAKDISRVLRLPGFTHRKTTTPVMVRIVEATGKRYSRADLVAAFPPVEREPREPPHAREWSARNDDDQRIREALNAINADDRDLWLQCGMAIKDYYGASGRGLWDQWSQRSKKYNQRDQDRTWRSLRRHGIGIGTLFHHAKVGWKAERPNSGATGSNGSGKSDSTEPAWKRKIFSARDLQAKIFEPLKYLVFPYIPAEGATLLCSRPKAGKSWLLYDLFIACTMNRYTLGEYLPLQGDILYLALEDSERRLRARMDKLLQGEAKKAWPERLKICTEWRPLHQGGLDDLRQWHEETIASGGNPICIGIDIITCVKKPTGNRPSYEAEYEALSMVRALAIELGIAIIAVHHTRKAAADTLLESVNGTFGTSGAVDNIVVLADCGSGYVLDITGRDVESASLAVEFNKTTCRWRIKGSSAEIFTSEQRQKILAALRAANRPMTVAELVEATWIKRPSLEMNLSRLVHEKEIQRIGRGQYANRDWKPPEPPENPKGRRSYQSNPTDHGDRCGDRFSNKTEPSDIKKETSPTVEQSINLSKDRRPQPVEDNDRHSSQPAVKDCKIDRLDEASPANPLENKTEQHSSQSINQSIKPNDGVLVGGDVGERDPPPETTLCLQCGGPIRPGGNS